MLHATLITTKNCKAPTELYKLLRDVNDYQIQPTSAYSPAVITFDYDDTAGRTETMKPFMKQSEQT